MSAERLDVFVTTDRGEKTYWTKVGSAFVNRDGSTTVLLDALPLNGKLQIRTPVSRDGDDEGHGRGRR